MPVAKSSRPIYSSFLYLFLLFVVTGLLERHSTVFHVVSKQLRGIHGDFPVLCQFDGKVHTKNFRALLRFFF